MNSNRAECATFWVNALYTVYALRWSNTANKKFESHWVFLGPAELYGYNSWVKWKKGPKMANLKKKLAFWCHQNWQYLCEKLPRRFSTIGPNKYELLFGDWQLFFTKICLQYQYQILEHCFWIFKLFPDFETRIDQQNFFIIWQYLC